MNINRINKHLEYLSLILVLSFILIKNIYIVFIGLSLSLYLINKHYLLDIIKFIKTRMKSESSTIIEESKLIEIKKEKNIDNASKLELVQAVEELGFIPSIENKNKKEAA